MAEQDRHRLRRRGEAFEVVLACPRGAARCPSATAELGPVCACGRQLAADQQVGHLDEVALLGQLLDRDAAVAEDALLAVDERDRARARAVLT